jgi:hypothetical protein
MIVVSDAERIARRLRCGEALRNAGNAQWAPATAMALGRLGRRDGGSSELPSALLELFCLDRVDAFAAAIMATFAISEGNSLNLDQPNSDCLIIGVWV